MVDQDLEWDFEAEQEAMAEAQRVAERDPEAAALLMAQLAVSQEIRRERNTYEPFEEEYNPTRLYAQMMKFYRIQPSELNKMHYLLFFGLLREANAMLSEEEQKTQGMLAAPRQYSRSEDF